MQIKENVPLAPYTTFGIGGPARFFATAESVEELKEALEFAKQKQLPVCLLGGGSNMLVSDKGWSGLVLKIELKGVEIAEDPSNTTKKILIAAAGESWDSTVERAVAESLWGLENLSGIPGTVGGAVVQNIGAYGAALSEVLVWAEVLDTRDGTTKTLTNAECLFDYRDSAFKHLPHFVVIRAAFNLSTTPKANVSYKDLAARFNDSSLDIAAIRAAVLEIRKGKFPDLALEGTAGSFFKNAIVGPSQAQALRERYPEMPLFDMPETAGVKVPLAWLLDKVLGLKGTRVGGARLFEKQPLVIVAQKRASSNDVITLAQKIKKEVQEKLQITIEEEVKII